MQAEILEAHLRTSVGGSSLWRKTDVVTLEVVNVNGMRGITPRGLKPRNMTTTSGHLFTPETNVLLLVYAEPQEPASAYIQGTVKRGSQRSGHRAT